MRKRLNREQIKRLQQMQEAHARAVEQYQEAKRAARINSALEVERRKFLAGIK